MVIERPNFYILTGGPGAGKTTVLEALRQRGFGCVDEAARQILREQAAIGGDATHDGDRAKYRDLCLARSIAGYEASDERTAAVFFDRGIPEHKGWGLQVGAEEPAYVTEAIHRYRYNRTVFVFPPWEDIYCHDEERKHTFQHAVEVCVSIAETYRQCGYQPVEVPRLPVADRADFILARLGQA